MKYWIFAIIFWIPALSWDFAQNGADWDTGSCLTGQRQSPININLTAIHPTSRPINVTFHYENPVLDLKFENRSNQLQTEEGATMGSLYLTSLIAHFERHFNLVSIQFHAHSEHAIDGKFYPLEMQMVHHVQGKHLNYANHTIVIISVLFNVSQEENAMLRDFKLGELKEGRVMLNDHMEGIRKSFYSYNGSLNTPDCNETAQWLIVEDIQKCTQQQIDEFTGKIQNNYRNLQPLNERIVRLVHSPGAELKLGSFQLVCLITAGGVLFLMILNCIQLSCKGPAAPAKKPDALLSS